MTDAVTLKWIRSKIDEVAVNQGCYFDLAAGQHVVSFFEKFLYQSQGQWAGKPFQLMDWQKYEVLMPMFGWKRKDGTRRYRIAYIEIPKKNGKSTLSSGLALYLLVADKEPGAQVFAAASDKEQASIVFSESANMVRASHSLSGRLDIIDSKKRILYKNNASYYRVLSADAFRAEGLNIHGLIFDELHAQPDRRLWDALRYGGAARRQPLLASITTAGYDRHSICWEQHDYASKVRDGVFEDITFFPYIRAASENDDWTKEETWRKANPSLGVTINIDSFASDCKEAQDSPTKENSFKRYRLNVWTEQENRWLQMAQWDKGSDSIDESEFEFSECYSGLDLSSTTDVSAFAMVFVRGEKKFIIPRFWIPKDNALARERRDRVPYTTWERQGLIKFTEGNVVDYDVIRADINDLGKRFNIKNINTDRWNATQIINQLVNDGFTVVPFGQGFGDLSAPTKEFERIVLDETLVHGGNPILRWMASNVSVKTDPAGNIKPVKPEHQNANKIDGIVAGIMGLGGYLRSIAENSSLPGVYAL